MQQLKIDPEFQFLIPPLSEEEFRQLAENIKVGGCRDALVIWQGTIIDGHNRYRICQENKIPFRTEEISFSDRNEAIEWIIRNQFGRRNLSAMQRCELALKLKPMIQEKAEANQIQAGKNFGKGCQNSDKAIFNKVDTKKELAELAGVFHDTIVKTKKILEQGTPDQVERARKGGKGNSVNAIYKEVTGKTEPKIKPITKEKTKVEMKVCSRCGEELPLSSFYVGRNQCKYCLNDKRDHGYRDIKENKIVIP